MLYGDGIHDDTLELQTMLDGRGIVTVDNPGVYLVSRTLIIHSNTRFVLSPGARLIAAPMSRCALIEKEHFTGGGRDENIEIEGGIWDGNCDEMGLDAEYEARHRRDVPYEPYNFKGKLIRFANLDRIHLSRMTVRNPVSYGIQIAAVYGFVVRDIFFDYNWHFGTADGVHINGPACDGVIENLSGTTNDDMVSLTTYDEEHAEISLGDIEHVYIHNVSARNGYSAVRFISGENFSVKHIRVDGVYGTYRHHGIIISNHNSRPGRVWFDDIVLEHFHASKSHTPLGEGCFLMWEKNAPRDPFICFGTGARCGNIVIRDIYRHEEQSSPAPLFSFADTCEIDRLCLENILQTTAEGVPAPPTWDNRGVIHTLVERNAVHG
ncbi:MAG: hypothetical protein IJV72_07505 [Clostridia bacterium]|nr:hypothetical protein [Clostridia bacterium]